MASPTPTATENTGPSRWRVGLTGLAFALGYFAVMATILAHWDPFEFNQDEGINLIKAALVSEGYTLYSEIWSDQPPVFTHLLQGAFSVFGRSVEVGRLTVLAAASLLLWATYVVVQRSSGSVAAVLAVLLVVTLPHFWVLSIAVMIGLPSLSFACLSLVAIVHWHTSRPRWALAVAGIALGVSILTKLFTGILIPVFFAGLWLDRQDPRARGRAIATFGGALLATLLSVGVLCLDWGQLAQLYEPHARARTVPQFAKHSVVSGLLESSALVALAVLGLVAGLRRRSWLTLYPAAWAALGLLALLTHRPVWSHQRLLVTIPVAMLAATALSEVWRIISTHRAPWRLRGMEGAFAGIALGLLVLGLAQTVDSKRGDSQMLQIKQAEGRMSFPVVEEMTQHASETRWVVTDRPMFAFRAGLLVPPEIAVTSKKRLRTRSLNQAKMLDVVQTYDPEQILLVRFQWTTARRYVEDHYRPIHFDEDRTLYLSPRLGGPPNLLTSERAP